ncbi:MAG: hypothetical protein HY706_18090, partial [Candidatus Hydrogenedentes bacterium]|nr:hypothetical protein [Candidatus Hydrogenedentota bacterium]
AWEWDWSSAGAHCGETDGDAILDVAAWRARVPAKEWKARLKAVARDKVVEKEIRGGTHTGRPLGSDSFLSKLEHRLGRRVRALPMGRQKGWRKSAKKLK